MRVGILWRGIFVVAIVLIVFSVRWDRVAAQVEGIPPNVVVDSNGNWFPAPGYCWANQIEDDYSVLPVGTTVPGLNNVVFGEFCAYSPAAGYCWASPFAAQAEVDYSVVPVGSEMPGLNNVICVEADLDVEDSAAPATQEPSSVTSAWAEERCETTLENYDYYVNRTGGDALKALEIVKNECGEDKRQGMLSLAADRALEELAGYNAQEPVATDLPPEESIDLEESAEPATQEPSADLGSSGASQLDPDAGETSLRDRLKEMQAEQLHGAIAVGGVVSYSITPDYEYAFAFSTVINGPSRSEAERLALEDCRSFESVVGCYIAYYWQGEGQCAWLSDGFIDDSTPESHDPRAGYGIADNEAEAISKCEEYIAVGGVRSNSCSQNVEQYCNTPTGLP